MKSNLYRPGIELTSEQELAAVTSFLASLAQNVLPSTVDPSKPIDPSLVLDFDMRSPRAPEEVKAMVEDIWNRNPVFAYTKVSIGINCSLGGIFDGFCSRPIVLSSPLTGTKSAFTRS